MLDQNKTLERTDRHSETQEDFTPKKIVDEMLERIPLDIYSQLDKTFLDTSCGNGNLLVGILERKLQHCTTISDVFSALKSVYGVELMADNVEECRQRLYNVVIKAFPPISQIDTLRFKVRAIIRNRIQWCDSLVFDYEHWPSLSLCPRKGHMNVSFNEIKHLEDTKYPMWYKEKNTIYN